MDICETWRYVPNSLPQQGQRSRSSHRAPTSGGRLFLFFLMGGSFLCLEMNHFTEKQFVFLL